MFVFSSCTNNNIQSPNEVILTTADNVVIRGTYYQGASNRGLILLHQLGSDRHSYDKFIQEALKYNFSIIAIDFRGHGDSEMDYADFTEDDFKGMEKDATAAKVYLKSQGIKNIYVVGASIGANTAINLASHDKEIEAVIALSPSFNYKGISTRDNVINLKIPLLIIISNGDSVSYDDSLIMAKLTDADLLILSGFEHGTNTLTNETEDKIFEWLEE